MKSSPKKEGGGSSSDKGNMSVHDAGKKGGQRVRELVGEGKQQEPGQGQNKS